MLDVNADGGEPSSARTGSDPHPGAGPPGLRDRQLGRSNLQELAGVLPDLGRLLRALVIDPRVPLRAKVVAGAAVVYVTVPVGPFPEVVRGTGIGVDDLVAVGLAVRHLVAAAGYEVVRELWTGTDAGFVFLMLLTGVEA